MDIERIRKMKLDKRYKIEEINYARVGAMRLYDTSIKGLIKEIVLLFYFDFKVTYTHNSINERYLIYTLRNANRLDYDEIIDMFMETNPEFNKVEIIQIKTLENLHVKVIGLVKNFIRYLAKRVDNPLHIALITTKYRILYNKLKKEAFLNNADMIITFCDAYPPDNLITQIAKVNNIKTGTLQHGQYRILSHGNENADAEAYENFISDYLFAWGQATVDEFIKVNISSNRLLKTGALRAFSRNKRVKFNLDNKVFGVVLCGETYSTTNINMIKLANQFYHIYGLKYFLRMHPRNPQNKYLSYVTEGALFGYSNNISNDEYARMIDFSLIHMTGVFVELLSMNTPIAIYKDSYLEEIFRIDPYCVTSVEELASFYNTLLNNSETILNDQYSKYLYFNQPENELRKNYISAINIITNKAKAKLII
ncbi:hypothetical protein [Sporomusa termitida]|uniref:CDP-Glycerol:Poly(Glycerophosphate) glycerophosphotransferase n=1 Tax=Sporomusa termitida TaxID=2377 RepID=A0A517DXE2_9FIRM|nr:hypothetical protein [Sporomusa termitida]QDR82017.1 hypothetical protein SPTER_34380 [Sporomusa termitida]